MSTKQVARPTLCLAMIVRDEAPVIRRSLLSIKPFIDTWLIHDLGSSDDTKQIIEQTLNDINGTFAAMALTDFADARNNLLGNASQLSDTIIMLDADEEVQSLDNHLSLPNDVDAGLIDIVHADHILRLPRLFRSSALPCYHFPIDEKAFFSEQQTLASIEGVAIQHHRDGIRHRYPSMSNNVEWDKQHPDISPASMALYNGQQALKTKQYQAALAHFNITLDSANSSAEFWQAAYLAANTQLLLGNIQLAIDLFQRCFESDPDRAEPLMRIAEQQFEHGELQNAYSLCRLIVDMPVPKDVDYVEHTIYSHTAQDLLIKSGPTTLSPGDTFSPESQSAHSQLEKTDEQLNLTIGMATYDDYDGVYFSIVSLVLYHQEFLDQLEILVIDNNPDSSHGKAVKNLCDRVSQARYVAAGEYKGTAVRERVFAEAKGEFVVCMDCHVFLHQGAVERLLAYAADNPNSKDLLHGPLFYDNHESFSTHMNPVWNEGFYGTWGTDNRAKNINADPFEIPLQGMGLFACFKRHWLGFNHRFRGFGGEEGYIHEKFRQNGGRVLCLPFLRWTHRFDRPNGTQYVNAWEDRIRNYLIGWDELDLDTKPILEHFAMLRGFGFSASINARFLRERGSPLWGHDTIYLISNSKHQAEQAKNQLNTLAIDDIIQEINSISDVPMLLRTALARKLKDVIVIDLRHGSPSELHTELKSLVGQNDTDITIRSASPSTSYQLCLIKHTAFERAASCYEQHQFLPENGITEHDDEVSATVKESPMGLS